MKKKIIILTIAGAAIYAALLLMPADKKEKSTETVKIPAATTAERKEYFAMHGWEVEEISSGEIKIPSEISGEYEKYAEIQDSQGLPLRKHAGENACIYVYEVKNFRPENNNMFAELIVCNDNIISSLVYSEDGESIQLAVN